MSTYPRRVLAWNGDGWSDVLWEHEDGRLTHTTNKSGFDQRRLDWVVDTRVDLPQEPPEPEPEHGWYLVSSGEGELRVMVPCRSGVLYYPDGWKAGPGWQVVAPLTPEQVAAIEETP